MKEFEKYEVNPKAEDVAAKVALALLISGIIEGVICIIAGIVVLIDDAWQAGLFASLCLVLAIIFVVAGILAWAIIKLFVNISRSLYNINNGIISLHDTGAVDAVFRNKIICPDCGKEIPIGAKECPNCGCPSSIFEK